MQLSKDFLSRPYPQMIKKWRVVLFVSCFIALFIGVFQPFGLSAYQGANKFLVFSGYGLVVFIILLLNLFILPLLFKKLFDRKKWTVLKQILLFSWILFTIGIGNFLYTSYLFFMFWSIKGFFLFQFFTLIIGIIPIVALIIINQNMRLAKSLKQSSAVKTKAIEENKTISMLADNEKDQLEILLDNLLYIEAAGNYAQIYYLQGEEVKNTLLRTSLKRLEFQLIDYSMLVKCHRSFIVNTNQVSQVIGNSQNLKLSLKKEGMEVPVSRNYARHIKGIKA